MIVRCWFCERRDATSDPEATRYKSRALVFCDDCRDKFGRVAATADERTAIHIAKIFRVDIVHELLSAVRDQAAKADRAGILAPVGIPKKMIGRAERDLRDQKALLEKQRGASWADLAEREGITAEAMRMRAYRRRKLKIAKRKT